MTKEQPPMHAPPPPYPGYPTPLVVSPPEESVNWHVYWQILLEQKKRIGLIVAVSTLLGLGTAFLMTPIYRTETLLAPVTQEKTGELGSFVAQFSDVAGLVGQNRGGSGRDGAAEAIAALKSRALATTFFKEENILPELFPRKWDSEKKVWKVNSDAPTVWKAFEEFDRNIRFVSVDNKTGLVTLTIEWKDPIRAAQWANKLVNIVNARLRAEAVEDADKSISYLKEQLGVTSEVEVQQAIYRLIEAQIKRRMVANTREEYAFKVIDPAVTPERPARPKKLVVTLAGFDVGLMIAVVYVLARRVRRR